MRKRSAIGFVVMLLLALGRSIGSGQVVAVILRLDTNVVAVGGSTTLHVDAQILPAYRSGSERIFSWYVDVLNTNGTVAGANYDALQKVASDQDPLTSSRGTTDGANQRGIYDTFLELAGAGRDVPVELMSIPITGLAPGQTRFSVQAGTGVPELEADFLVAPAEGDEPLLGGDYGTAYVDLTVISNVVVAPRLTITRTSLGNGTNRVVLLYEVLPGFDYYVEYQNTLGDPAGWQTFPGGPHNSGQYIDITPLSNRFYRVRVEPQGALGPVHLQIVPGPVPGQARLVYPVTADYNYTIEYRESLESGVWQTLPGAPHNAGDLTVSTAIGHRFYRLKVSAI